MFKNREQNNKGFTLVEMIVSIALFSIVVLVAIGSILTIIDANRKSQTLTLVMNNLNFALEVMTRNIKTADLTDPSDFSHGTQDFSVNGDSYSADYFSLKDQDGNYYTYLYFVDESAYDSGIARNIYRTDGENNTIAYPIISDDVIIERFDFAVDTNGQPRVFLLIEGYAEITERVKSDFTVQTTVSPRTLDIVDI